MAKEIAPVFTSPDRRFDTAAKAHAGKEPRAQFQDLPPGITNGVARLVSLYFEKVTKEGDFKGVVVFHGRATVCEPVEVEHKGQRVHVYGLQTSISTFLADSKPDRNGNVRTAEDRVQEVMDVLARLAGREFTKNVKSMADVERLCQLLSKKQPYFNFSTIAGKEPTAAELAALKARGEEPKPARVYHNWYKAIAYNPQERNGGARVGTTDNTPAVASEADRTPADDDNEPVYTPDGLIEDEENLDELASLATAKDLDAQNKLEALGLEVGMTKDEVEAVDDWVTLVEEIRRRRESPTTSEDEPEPEVSTYEPDQGQAVKLRLLKDDGTPQTDKRGRPKAPLDCKVLKVHKKTKTVTLQDVINPTVKYENVPWSQLVPPE